jgi:hypothetical protein
LIWRIFALHNFTAGHPAADRTEANMRAAPPVTSAIGVCDAMPWMEPAAVM